MEARGKGHQITSYLGLELPFRGSWDLPPKQTAQKFLAGSSITSRYHLIASRLNCSGPSVAQTVGLGLPLK